MGSQSLSIPQIQGEAVAGFLLLIAEMAIEGVGFNSLDVGTQADDLIAAL